MANIYVVTRACNADTFIPLYFHSLDKAREYMKDAFLSEMKDITNNANIPFDKFPTGRMRVVADGHYLVEENNTRTPALLNMKVTVFWVLEENRYQIQCYHKFSVCHIDTVDEDEFPRFED